MYISYIILARELVTLAAMIEESDDILTRLPAVTDAARGQGVMDASWEEELPEVLASLESRGYIRKGKDDYMIDIVLYNLLKLIPEAKERYVSVSNTDYLFVHERLVLAIVRDERSDGQMKIMPFPNMEEFRQSSVSQLFLI